MIMELSNRLKTIANYVKPFRHVVDIGTDHCFVPIFLVLNQFIDKAIATDINVGPLNEAKKNVERNHLENVIETRIGNGLVTLDEFDRCDVIIIAGMGGKLISDILNSKISILSNNKRLILQPNVSESIVRSWLCENHYEIVYEHILEEDNQVYEVIVADKTKKSINLSREEKMFGPILMSEKSNLFIKKWREILQYKESVVKNIPLHHSNKEIFLNEIQIIKNMFEGGV